MLLDEAQKKTVMEAIQAAETNTSGEIRVHIEAKCPSPDPLERAKELFGTLGMHQTAQRNGVLFYLSVEDRRFAIFGDEGIAASVPENFWESTRDILRGYFQKNDFVGGLQAGIAFAGQQLKTFFPYQSDDSNELPDTISFG